MVKHAPGMFEATAVFFFREKKKKAHAVHLWLSVLHTFSYMLGFFSSQLCSFKAFQIINEGLGF